MNFRLKNLRYGTQVYIWYTLINDVTYYLHIHRTLDQTLYIICFLQGDRSNASLLRGFTPSNCLHNQRTSPSHGLSERSTGQRTRFTSESSTYSPGNMLKHTLIYYYERVMILCAGGRDNSKWETVIYTPFSIRQNLFSIFLVLF